MSEEDMYIYEPYQLPPLEVWAKSMATNWRKPNYSFDWTQVATTLEDAERFGQLIVSNDEYPLLWKANAMAMEFHLDFYARAEDDDGFTDLIVCTEKHWAGVDMRVFTFRVYKPDGSISAVAQKLYGLWKAAVHGRPTDQNGRPNPRVLSYEFYAPLRKQADLLGIQNAALDIRVHLTAEQIEQVYQWFLSSACPCPMPGDTEEQYYSERQPLQEHEGQGAYPQEKHLRIALKALGILT